MNTITIEWKRGERETCPYLARDPKEADGKLRFYAKTKSGWRVVTLEAVRPHGGRFVNETGNDLPSPFSDSPPKEITPCRLLAPPIYEDEEDAKRNRPENWPDYLPHIPEDRWCWETVYQKTHGEALRPKPEHEGEPRGPKGTRKGGPIRNMLALMRWAARADRRRDVAAWEQEVRRRSELPLERLEYESEEQRQERVKEARQQVEAARHYWRQIETLSLADLKCGCWPGEGKFPLHSFLESEWAKRNAVDLAAMERDATACREWIKTHCRNVTAIVQHHESGLGGLREIRAELVPDRWDFFDAPLARVRYKVTFRNDAVLYLVNKVFEEARDPSAQEQAEIERVCPGSPVSESPQYKIERRGKRSFKVTFEGVTFDAEGAGMLYIVTFFKYAARRKSDDPDPLFVMTESWGTTPDEQSDKPSEGAYESAEFRPKWNCDRAQAARFVRENLPLLKRLRELENREHDLDDDELRELDALKKTIGDPEAVAKEIIKQVAIRDGKRFVSGDERPKARDTMLRAINRTLANMLKKPSDGIPVADDARQAAKRFEDHVRTFLARGNLKSYTLPPGVSWILPD